MIVVDTNVVAYLLIPGEPTEFAERLRAKDKQWFVPSLFRHEWLNVVARHLDAQTFSRDDAIRRYRRGLASVTVRSAAPDLLRVLNVFQATGCTSYDCQFIAEAMALRTNLITLDKKILESAPEVAVSLKNF